MPPSGAFILPMSERENLQTIVSNGEHPVRGTGSGWTKERRPEPRSRFMVEYLITANEEWVPDYSEERMEEMSKAVKALRAEMKAAGVYVFLGGLDDSAPVFSVDATSGSPMFTDGPYTETKEHLGGFVIVDVPDEETARLWAGKVATACVWPHEVHRFQAPSQSVEN
jgi:hypothetical protein